MGARERSVYFPKGASWVNYFTKKSYEGGTTAVITGPIDEFPIFKKKTPAASSAASVVLVLEDAQKK
jgi:alpha-glucosidase (family GH31 glycosyl hydrolase)